MTKQKEHRRGLLSLPNEILLQVFQHFRGSDFYGPVLVNKQLNLLLTGEMYRHLRLYLPNPNGSHDDNDEEENGYDSEEGFEERRRTEGFWEDDDECMVDLFENFSIDKMASEKRMKAGRKGSGALLKRTFKENPELASLVKEIAVIGHDLTPKDIKTTPDGMTEFPLPPDAAYKGVRNLLRHLTNLESLCFSGDSAQLSAFIGGVPSSVSSLALERLSRLQLGDVYKFRKLRRLTIRAPTAAAAGEEVVLGKSVMWESFYAIRMLLEQNAATLEELVLGNLDLDMLFENYTPMLSRLKCLAIELDPAVCATEEEEESAEVTRKSARPMQLSSTGRLGWTWLSEFIGSTRSNMKVFFCLSRQEQEQKQRPITEMKSAVKGIDWKSLNRLEGGRRVKRKSVFKGHQMEQFLDWTRDAGGAAVTEVLMELTIRRHRSIVGR